MNLSNDPRRSFGRIQSCSLARQIKDLWIAREPADEIVETLFRQEVERHFPGDRVWGEELGGPSDWSGDGWIIDPVDGTRNYLAGVPLFSISIAWVQSGEPQLGWVVDPIRGEWFEAVRGRGLLRGGPGPAPIRRKPPLEVLALSPRWRRIHRNWRKNVEGDFKERSLGSIALEMAWIAHGRFAAGAWSRGRPWDIAAGTLLIEESRGQVVIGKHQGRHRFAAKIEPIDTSIVAVSANAGGWLPVLLKASS